MHERRGNCFENYSGLSRLFEEAAMSEYPAVDFLYLSEEDMIRAGVMDMAPCIDAMEEVLTCLAKGDFVMGGKNHYAHGCMLTFPTESPFPNMPLLVGEDRRFMAMPAYIGGSFGMEPVNKDDGRPVNSSLTAPCICRGIIKYIPRLKNAKIVRTWGGWMDKMIDGVPVIDAVPEVPELILSCGYTGHGFGISPAAATVTAQLVAGETPCADISGLKYDRFKAKA